MGRGQRILPTAKAGTFKGPRLIIPRPTSDTMETVPRRSKGTDLRDRPWPPAANSRRSKHCANDRDDENKMRKPPHGGKSFYWGRRASRGCGFSRRPGMGSEAERVGVAIHRYVPRSLPRPYKGGRARDVSPEQRGVSRPVPLPLFGWPSSGTSHSVGRGRGVRAPPAVHATGISTKNSWSLPL